MKDGLTKESLGPITRFAVFMGKESSVRPYGRIGDPGAVVADNLAMELVRCGYHVYDSEDIARSKSLKIEQIDQATALHAARSLGAEVIVTGNVTAGQNGSLGIRGAGRLTTVIESVSLKIKERLNGPVKRIFKPRTIPRELCSNGETEKIHSYYYLLPVSWCG